MYQLKQRFFAAALGAAALVFAPQAANAESVGAIGQIVPGPGFIDIGGLPGAIVRSIKVVPGQQVKQGELMMVLDSGDLNADFKLASMAWMAAKDIAKQQIAAQQLAVTLAAQNMEEANREYQVYRVMGSTATSTKEMNRLRGVAGSARLSVEMEKAKLKVVTLQAENDVRAAERRMKVAAASTEIRAPSGGTVLKIGRGVGERVIGEPVIRMADLRSMDVTCQVFEADLLKIRPGMRATIKNNAFSKPLTGIVRTVGRMVEARAKLGEVRIRLDRPSPADRLVGMEVEVVIGQ